MTKKAEVARRKRFLAQAYKRLMDLKAKLIDESQIILRTEREGNRDDCLDSSDLASEESGRELSTILSARERTKIEQINDALARITARNYGLCDTCGFEIAEARLSAVPLHAPLLRLPARARARREGSAAPRADRRSAPRARFG